MSVIGSNGLPECKSAGNVMLPFNEFRISIRLPPTKDHKVAEKELIKILTENPPYNAKVHNLYILDHFTQCRWCRRIQCPRIYINPGKFFKISQ